MMKASKVIIMFGWIIGYITGAVTWLWLTPIDAPWYTHIINGFISYSIAMIGGLAIEAK
mgnify:CR=1 FL=1